MSLRLDCVVFVLNCLILLMLVPRYKLRFCVNIPI
ncbi:hypothetical protein RDABS01_036266 [Bienertia sinuspersici]